MTTCPVAATADAAVARIIRERLGLVQVDVVVAEDDETLVLYGYNDAEGRTFIATHCTGGIPDPQTWETLPIFKWHRVDC